MNEFLAGMNACGGGGWMFSLGCLAKMAVLTWVGTAAVMAPLILLVWWVFVKGVRP